MVGFPGEMAYGFWGGGKGLSRPYVRRNGISTLRESNAVGVFVHPSDGRAFVGGVLGCYRGEMLRGEPEV